MSREEKPNKFQEIQDSLSRIRKRVMDIGAYKGCIHTALAAVNDLSHAEDLLKDIEQDFKALLDELSKFIQIKEGKE